MDTMEMVSASRAGLRKLPLALQKQRPDPGSIERAQAS